MGRDFSQSKGPSDYCVLGASPEHRLSQFERLTLVGGRELERALSLVARQMAAFSAKSGLTPFDRNAVASAAAFYRLQRSVGVDPFRRTEVASEVGEVSVHGLVDGEVVDLQFESGFRCGNPSCAPLFDGDGTNRVVRSRWWRHYGAPRPTVVAIHGWTMGDPRLNSLAFLPGVFYRLGVDVVLFELPFHGRRQRDPQSGSFPSTDLAHTNEAMAQAIVDLRSVHAILGARGCSTVGAIGMSLGGYVASLWGSLDPLAFCVPVVPLVSMGDLAWQVVRGEPQLGAAAAGVTPELLNEVFSFHSPLNLAPRTATDRVMIVASRGDAVVPAEHSERLWEHWGRPSIEWVSGGHETLFQRSQAFSRVCEFLARLGVIKFTDSADLPPAP